MGMEKWCYHVGIPVCEPKYERRNLLDIMFDLADRLEIRDKYNNFLEGWFSNKVMKWEQKQTISTQFDIIRPEEKIGTFEFTNRVLNFAFGKNYDIKWFMEHGFMSWNKKPEECYWRYSVNARVPIYYEINEHDKPEVVKRAESIGIHMDWDQYTSLLSYFPSVFYTDAGKNSEFDLVAVSPHDSLHLNRFTAENPWLDEVSKDNPYVYNIVMNSDTAREKGIKEGEFISLENFQGASVKGKVKLSQLIHRKSVAMLGLGSWAKGRPIAQGIGVNFNDLLPADQKHHDPICGAFEICVMVKVNKVEQPR
jgi:anaerobic selenocysteine-containing dehydrogenase